MTTISSQAPHGRHLHRGLARRPRGRPDPARHAGAGRPVGRRVPARQAPRDQAPRQDEQGRVQPGDARRARAPRGGRRRAGRARSRRRRAAEDRDAAPPRPWPLREWTERIDGGRFTGQTVIVTGAGSGIGRATASRVAREGGRVIAVDISQERLDEFRGEHAGRRHRARRRRHHRRRVDRRDPRGRGRHHRRPRQHRRDHGRHDAGRRRDGCRVGPGVPHQRHGHHEAHARRHPDDARPGRRLDRQHRVGGGPPRLRRRRGLHGVEARGRGPHEEQRVHVRPLGASA